VRARRKELGVTASFQRVDTCAAEFQADTPYMYSSYDGSDECEPTNAKKVRLKVRVRVRVRARIKFRAKVRVDVRVLDTRTCTPLTTAPTSASPPTPRRCAGLAIAAMSREFCGANTGLQPSKTHLICVHARGLPGCALLCYFENCCTKLLRILASS